MTKNKGIFITGTDTDVGKTYIGSRIVSSLYEAGVSVTPRKPIESGCDLIGGELQPNDAKQYHDAAKGRVPLADICPFRFEPAISPQRAARLVNQPININEVKQACLSNVSKNDFLVVEGAGGFYSPLCEDGLNAELAEALQLPVLLIANNQLGCINHILLSKEAIEKRGLEVMAIVLNKKNKSHDTAMNNADDLKTLVTVPVFMVGKEEELNNESGLVVYIQNIFKLNKLSQSS